MLRQIATMFFAGLCFTMFAQSQTSDDEYTRYELLEPSTQSFRILYEVTATKPGMLYYFNTLRKGSEHKVDTVWDLRTGQPLKWSVVDGVQAKKDGLQEASAEEEYLKVQLAHAIANNSEYRLLIDKTYKDAKSYYVKEDVVVFERSLGIKRNSVVLPRGYELLSCNYPVQVSMESDWRIKASFINSSPVAVPLRIEARKLPMTVDLKVEKREYTYTSGEGRDKSKARVNYQVPERANQTREIVYFLQQPETHSFRLYHDYTEGRVGKNNYLNVVRAGSKASNPSAMNLDTGQPLKVETIKGNQVKEKGIVMEEEITPETEIIVIWYDAVKKGESTRIRIEETYTDPNRYVVNGNELVWDRAFGRPHNTVILPAGWFLTDNAIPATISTTQDGKISLYYMNYDPDEIDVFIKARKR